MSAISGKMEADVEIKQEVREEKPELVYPIINPSKSINPVNLEAGEAMPDDVIPESENEGDVRINDLLQPDLTGLGGDPEQDEPGYTGEKERQTIVTGYSKPRIIVNSIFKKEGMMPVAIEDFKYLNPDEEEVSGFARFLRQRTLKKEYYVSAPEKSEIESINNEGTELITVEEVITPAPDLIKDISGENKSGDYKKKKKKKKHLVDRLVKQSLLENELLVSEPFAELLYAQGYREKAIKIYEKLIVKFPEKKLIFAAKIDEINKENN